MKRLTDVALRAALSKPIATRVDLRDGAVPGLLVRLGPGGAATWSLQFRVTGEGGVTDRGHNKKGRKYRLTLGEYPVVSIEAARGQANIYLDQAKRGVNPVRALAKVATAGGLIVEALAKRFLEDYVRMKELRAIRKYEAAIRVHIIPNIGNELADLLNREQIRNLVKKVMVPVARTFGAGTRRRGGKEAARTTLGVLRKMLNWGIREELLTREINPAIGMEENLPKKRSRERVLSVEEAQIVWHAAETLGYPFGPGYQLIMLTGCRKVEWSAAVPDWIDLNHAISVIPADHYKSGHVHIVPLVPLAVDILKGVMENHRGQSGPYLLSGTDGQKPLGGWCKAQARLMKAICAITGERTMRPFTRQDLRRTVATRIAEQLGIGGEQLIRRVLGHADGSVTAIYNRYGYVKEMRAVLGHWADELTAGPNLLIEPQVLTVERSSTWTPTAVLERAA